MMSDAVEQLTVKLTRIPVRAHDRVTESGVVHVDAHMRKVEGGGVLGKLVEALRGPKGGSDRLMPALRPRTMKDETLRTYTTPKGDRVEVRRSPSLGSNVYTRVRISKRTGQEPAALLRNKGVTVREFEIEQTEGVGSYASMVASAAQAAGRSRGGPVAADIGMIGARGEAEGLQGELRRRQRVSEGEARSRAMSVLEQLDQPHRRTGQPTPSGEEIARARLMSSVANIPPAADSGAIDADTTRKWRSLKSRTTRAEKLIKTDPARALNEFDRIMAEFDTVGWPDWWSKVERGRQDALFARRNQDAQDWGAGIAMGDIGPQEGPPGMLGRTQSGAKVFKIEQLLAQFGIPDTPQNRANARSLVNRWGLTEARRRMKLTGSRRVIVGGPPGLPDRLNRQEAVAADVGFGPGEFRPGTVGAMLESRARERGVRGYGGAADAEEARLREEGVIPGGRLTPSGHRPLNEIARDIRRNWPKVNFAAKPYLDALGDLDDVKDMYGADKGEYIVMYLLSNMRSFTGPEAKRLKAELKGVLKKA